MPGGGVAVGGGGVVVAGGGVVGDGGGVVVAGGGVVGDGGGVAVGGVGGHAGNVAMGTNTFVPVGVTHTVPPGKNSTLRLPAGRPGGHFTGFP